VELSLQDSSDPMEITSLPSGMFQVTLAATSVFNTTFKTFDRTFSCGVGMDGNSIDLNCPLTSNSHTCDFATHGSGGTYYFAYTCPYVEPTCLYWDEAAMDFAGDDCTLVSGYTSDAVTCECTRTGTFVLGADVTDEQIEYFSTSAPTQVPTPLPTSEPTHIPTPRPTPLPTPEPTFEPTHRPTQLPTYAPTIPPTGVPTSKPSPEPTFEPTYQPTVSPTHLPTPLPSTWPSMAPIPAPSLVPIPVPTRKPTFAPTWKPSLLPSPLPVPPPSSAPTAQPIAPTPAPTPRPTLKPTTRSPTQRPSMGPTSVDTASVNVLLTLTASAAPTETDKANIKSSIETAADITGAVVKNFAVTSTSSRRLSAPIESRRRLTTFTWTVSCDIEADLSEVGESSGTSFASTVNTNLNSGTTLSDLITGSVASVSSLDSIDASLTTREPTSSPTQRPNIATPSPVAASSGSSNKGSANILIIALICGGAVLLGIVIYFCKDRFKSDENEVDIEEPANVGNKILQPSESRDESITRGFSLDRPAVKPANVPDNTEVVNEEPSKKTMKDPAELVIKDTDVPIRRKQQRKSSLMELEEFVEERCCTSQKVKSFFGVLFTSIGAVSFVADKSSSIYLLYVIYNRAINCSDCNLQYFSILLIVFSTSLITPYLIAYSTGVHVFLERGNFDTPRLETDSYLVIFGKWMFSTFMGPLFYVSLDIILVVKALTQMMVSVQILCNKRNISEERVNEYFGGIFSEMGMDEMNMVGYKKQRSMSLLFFSDLPDIILQMIIYAEVVSEWTFLKDNAFALAFSTISTFFSMCVQVWELRTEADGFKEGYIQYSLTCMLALLDFVPFFDKIRYYYQAPPESRGSYLDQQKVINYANFKFDIPLLTKCTDFHLTFPFEFTDNSINNVINNIALISETIPTTYGEKFIKFSQCNVFPDATASSSIKLSVKECEEMCQRQNYGAFVIEKDGTVSFKDVPSVKCEEYLTFDASSTTYLAPRPPSPKISFGDSVQHCTLQILMKLVKVARGYLELTDLNDLNWRKIVLISTRNQHSTNDSHTIGEEDIQTTKWNLLGSDGVPVLLTCLETEHTATSESSDADAESKRFYLGDVTRKLLKSGADPEVVHENESMLMYCARTGRSRGLQLLLKYGKASVNRQIENRVALTEAIRAGELGCVNQLLEETDVSELKMLTNFPAESSLSFVGHAIQALIGSQLNIKKQDIALDIIHSLIDHKCSSLTQDIHVLVRGLLSPIVSKASTSNSSEAQFLNQLVAIGPKAIGDWKDLGGNTVFHHAANGVCGFHSLNNPQFFLLEHWCRKFDMQDYARLKNNEGDTALIIAIRGCRTLEKEDARKAPNLITYLLQFEDMSETEEMVAVLSQSIYRLVKADNAASLGTVKFLVGLFPHDVISKLDLLKQFQTDSFSNSSKRKDILKTLFDELFNSGGLEQFHLLSAYIDNLVPENKPNNDKAKSPQAPTSTTVPTAQPAIVNNVAIDIEKGDTVQFDPTEAPYLARRAFEKTTNPGTPPPERLTMLINFLKWLLELVSAGDLVTDLIIVEKMSHFAVGWTTASILMISAPYLISYAATIRLMTPTLKSTLKNNHITSTVIGVIAMCPLCIILLICIDITYMFQSIVIDTLVGLFNIVSPKNIDYYSRVNLIHHFEKYIVHVLELSHMDVLGYRRMRTQSQLIFESFPQVGLQLWILTSKSRDKVGVDTVALVSSICLAGFHLFVSMWILWLESRVCKTSMVQYTFQCLAGRLGWVPFIERFMRVTQSPHTTYNYGCLETKLFGQIFHLEFEFAPSTWTIFLYGLARLENQNEKSKRVNIELGNSIRQMGLADIVSLHRTTNRRINLTMGNVDWDIVLANSGLVWLADGRLDPEHVLTIEYLRSFVQFNNIECVKELLNRGAKPFGVSTRGNLLLTEAVLHDNGDLCKLLLDHDCPLSPDERSFERLSANFNGVLYSSLDLPAEVAFKRLNLEVVDALTSHPRIIPFASKRGQLLKASIDEFTKAANVDTKETQKKDYFIARGQKLLFLGGGFFASQHPDGVPNGKGFLALAVDEAITEAQKWYHDCSTLVKDRVTIRFSSGDFEFLCSDIERFGVLRDMLSNPEKRMPLGHPDNEIHKKLCLAEDSQIVDFREVQTFFPNLNPELLVLLLHVINEQTVDNLSFADLQKLDQLSESLGLDRGLGNYISTTMPSRQREKKEFFQEGKIEINASDAESDRQRCVIKVTIPHDCWRVSGLKISGTWRDQGWGGTSANRVILSAHTKLAGPISETLLKVDREAKNYHDHPNHHIWWSALNMNDERKNVFGRSLLEVLTGGDELKLYITCVGWRGCESSAQDTKVEVEYAVATARRKITTQTFQTVPGGSKEPPGLKI
jgi:ankyrin repeat protein